ncbi:MAG: hypothetical protein J6K92_05980 [Oscillospiraceae bacterium]|nr:hypothetical protein [Oscillospiraceae bacterium]
MKDKIKDICTQMINGKISFEAFYDKLTAVCEDTRTDDDTACLLEDVLMELEMIGSETKSKKVLGETAKEAAERILKEV